jgi:hypothetical protein
MPRKKQADNLELTEEEFVRQLDEISMEFLKENPMAKAKTTTVKKFSDKLTKVNESFTIYRYDNGYMIEVSGRDEENDYKTSKIMCGTEDELVELVREVLSMEKDD